MKALLLTTALSLAAIETAAACDGPFDIMCTMPPVTVSIAQNDPNFSLKVARALNDAQKLTGQKKFAAARDRLAAVSKEPRKSALEEASVADAVAFIDFGLEDYTAAADSFGTSVGSGVLPRDGVISRLAVMTQLYYQTNTYDKAIDAGDRFTSLAGKDADILMIVGESHYVQRRFPEAAQAFHAAVKTAEDNHMPVKEQWLNLMMSADFYTHDTPGVIAALEQLVANYPKPEYQADLLKYKAWAEGEERMKASLR